MEEKLNTLKIAATAVVAALGGFLGWQGILLIAWLLLMLIDYGSGTWAAKTLGNWSSKVAREGIMHKGGMVLVVAAAGIADLVMCAACDQLPMSWEWPVLVLPLVLMWYILTEIGSVLENAAKMGAPVPQWFIDAMKNGLKVVDGQGAQAADVIAQDKREQEGIENG